MKQMIFILVISFFYNLVIYSQNKSDSLGYKQGLWEYNSPKDSTTNLFNVLIKCNFKNDTLNGLYQVFDSNGVLRKEGVYEKGVINGSAKIYDHKQQISYVVSFLNGELINLMSLKNGRLISITEYKNGLKNGAYCYFRKNGNLYFKTIYSNNIELEEYTFYRKNKLKKHTKYKTDNQNFSEKKYKKNGNEKLSM